MMRKSLFFFCYDITQEVPKYLFYWNQYFKIIITSQAKQDMAMSESLLRTLVDEVFLTYDRDRSNSLQKTELTYFFSDVFEKMQKPASPMQIQKAVQQTDVNYDGRVSREELYLTMKKMMLQGGYGQGSNNYNQGTNQGNVYVPGGTNFTCSLPKNQPQYTQIYNTIPTNSSSDFTSRQIRPHLLAGTSIPRNQPLNTNVNVSKIPQVVCQYGPAKYTPVETTFKINSIPNANDHRY